MSRKKLVLVVLLAIASVAVAGCTGSTDGPDAGSDTGTTDGDGMDMTEQEFDEKKGEAQQVTNTLKRTLVGKLQAAINEGGPQAAIPVCKDQAPAVAANLSRQNGWKVTRVSLGYRNPVLGMPDEYEAEVLQNFEQKAANGANLANVSSAEVVTEPSGTYFRYMEPLGTQELCLNCHGNEEQIPPAVQDRLDDTYPHDRATGYAPGDVRGAVSIKIPLDG